MFRHFLIRTKGYRKDTCVAFDSDGHVSVNISERDNKKYREELTFDQLCRSLGDLFKEFLALHKKVKAK